jgi:hypothetical protein
MSDDTIRVPFRGRSDSLADVADAARALPAGEDRAVVRGLVLEAAESGMASAGDMLDALERMAPDGRRRLLDRARERADVPTTTEAAQAAARKVRAPMIPDSPPRDATGCAIQVCPATGCGRYPLSPLSGATAPVAARRWWCPEHEHLAGPGDLDPWTAPLVAFGPGGGLVFPNELTREAEIAEREAGRRAAELEQRRAQRLVEWQALEGERAAQADQFRRATLPGAP